MKHSKTTLVMTAIALLSCGQLLSNAINTSAQENTTATCANLEQKGYIKLRSKNYQKYPTAITVSAFDAKQPEYRLVFTVKAKYREAVYYTMGTDSGDHPVFGCVSKTGKMVNFGMVKDSL